MFKILWRYRRLNGLLVLALLSTWAIVSYGFGILLAGMLNSIHLWGFPIGYWFATQGSVIIFVVLAFAYCFFMSKLERLLKPED
jgi:putative solute:sodium symporter small subunit